MLHKSSSNRRISKSTVQRRLRESGLQGRNAAKKPLLKTLLGPRNKSNGHSTGGNLSFGLSPNFEIYSSNRRVFARRGVSEQMTSACVVPTVKHGGGVQLTFNKAHLLIEMHSRWLPHELVERMPRVCKVVKTKGGYFEETTYHIFWFVSYFLGYYMIPYVLFHSVVFTIILQCRK